MHKTLLSTALLALFGFASAAYAGDTAALFPEHERSVESMARDAHNYRAWKFSLAPVIAGQALDVASSYGMRELNPMMASQDGRFGMKGASIKIGVSAAMLGAEYLIIRRNPSSSRLLTKLNWAAGFVTIGFATHNFAIK
jgi:hypothetical protein